MKNWKLAVLSLVVSVVALVLGCESTSGVGSSIEIEPSSADLVGIGSVRFTATVNTNQPLIQPLTWSVDDPTLGTIREAAGLSAVYISSGREGVNTITVQDQADRSTVAVVNQLPAAQE